MNAALRFSAALLALGGCGDDRRTPAVDQAGVIEPAQGGGAAGGAGSPGSGGAAGASGGGVSSMEPGSLGLPCDDQEDCAGGLSCLSSVSNSLDLGSPPGGLCTRSCDDDPSRCNELGGRCLDIGGNSFCVQSCAFGPGAKCHGRRDFACEPTYRSVDVACDVDADCGAQAVCRGGACQLVVPLCLPRCNGPADCPDRAHCDPVSGECVREAPEGDPVGAECSVEADTCRGLCTGRCTEFCTLGAEGACGPGAACVLTLGSIPSSAPGDQGACAALCNCNDDCDFGLSCLPLAEPVDTHVGHCGVPTASDAPLDCGNGGAGGQREG